jgi:hypothetical protein
MSDFEVKKDEATVSADTTLDTGGHPAGVIRVLPLMTFGMRAAALAGLAVAVGGAVAALGGADMGSTSTTGA